MRDATGCPHQSSGSRHPPVEHGVASFTTSGKVISFPGFLRAYVESSDDPRAEMRRSGDAPAAARRRADAGDRGRRRHRPHDPAAAALHRGDSGQGARSARHRPTIDLRHHHPDHPGSRLCLDTRLRRWCRPSPPSRWSVCSRITCRIWSTMTSPPAWRTNSTPSPAGNANPCPGCTTSTSADRPRAAVAPSCAWVSRVCSPRPPRASTRGKHRRSPSA